MFRRSPAGWRARCTGPTPPSARCAGLSRSRGRITTSRRNPSRPRCATSPYEEANIVFRSNACEIRCYNYRRWVDPPEEMLRSFLQARPAQGGSFADVTPRIHNPGEHLALCVRLNALDALDRGDGRWTARIAARFNLRTSRDKRIVWRYAFDAEQPVARHDVLGVVEALSVVYNREMDRMLHFLAAFAASHPAWISPVAAGG